MHKNKVITVLKSLSAEEMRQLDKFVRSPIHNQHEEVVRLFQHLRRHLNGHERGLEKERVHGHLFPGAVFNMQQLHYVSSYLLKVVEEFLAWKEWRSDEASFGIQLIKSYGNRRLEELHRAVLSKAKSTINSQPRRDSLHYQKVYYLNLQEYFSAKSQGRYKEIDLQELIDSQDIAFIIEKLKNGCNELSHRAVNKTEHKMGLLQAVVNYLDGHGFLQIPSVAVYYHAYLALSDLSNESSFIKLKELLKTHNTAFSNADLRDLYLFAINYCIRKLNSGNSTFLREVFDIYQSGLAFEIFIENGEFSPWTYSNYIISGLRLGEYDKVETFINTYTDMLPEKQRDGLYRYNNAFLHFEKRDYKKAMFFLSTTDYGKDLLTACAAKTLLARIYFEQNEMETLQNLLQSFKVFIGRKELLGYHKDSYGNFIQILYKLILLKSLKSPDTSEVKSEIANFKVVAAKDWLMEQASSLSKVKN